MGVLPLNVFIRSLLSLRPEVFNMTSGMAGGHVDANLTAGKTHY